MDAQALSVRAAQIKHTIRDLTTERAGLSPAAINGDAQGPNARERINAIDAERSRLVAEPSGALGIAAMAFHAREAGLDPRDGPIVAVVSGGNVDPDRYREYLSAPIPPEG
jgi:hypothetical protein